MKSKSRSISLLAIPLSLLSGVALAYALPPRDINLLGWVAFLPLLLVACSSTRPLVVAGCGLLTGCICGLILAGYVNAVNQVGNMVGVFGALALVLAFTSGFASFGWKRLSPAVWPFFVACSGVAAEWLSWNVFPVSIAISQHRNPLALHIASFTGAWGVSFLLWLAPASLIVLFSRPKAARAGLILCVIVVVCSITAPFPKEHNGHRIAVAAIQASGPYTADSETKRVAGKASLVVWPEQLISDNNPIAQNVAKRDGVYLAASFLEEHGPDKKYNTVRLISPSGKTVAITRKLHLFGKERIKYYPGHEIVPMRCANFTAGTPICFDTEFTDITRELVRHGANVVLVGNSDPYFANGIFNYLHVAIIPFRAAENGVPVVWSECCGLSSIFDSHGKQIICAPMNAITSVCGNVTLRTHSTFYTLAGDYFAYLCTAAFMLALCSSCSFSARRKQPTSSG